ncbi:MAG: outer rane efflux protein [Myxococcaceae bacterium]|nr:outer rane efflux protein [Myxococcaceae bacterium]
MNQGRRGWVVVAAILGTTVASPAYALQPLEAFIASSKQNNPDNKEASAIERQRDAQRDVATAAYLPSFTAQGVYTRNQYEAAFALPGGPTFVITPLNGLDAYFTLTVPIVNVGAWEQRRAATANKEAAAATRANTQVTVESNVTQAYYQLLGSEAVLFAAKKSLEAADGNLRIVRDRKELGTASELDLQRATADLARAQQNVATGDQGVINARRSLESVARLTPEPATRENYREDDLRDEPPLNAWLGRPSDDLVAVRPALLAVDAAEKTRSATRAAWLPTISATGQEHVTNAGGFTGNTMIYTLQATANWRLDFSLGPNVAAQTAAVSAAEAREDKARRAAEDAIYQAWYEVRAEIEKARGARAELKAAALAQDLARDRYQAGVATQLEVVQAQRDYFSAGVSQAQADFNLQFARAQLRLASKRTGNGESSR